MIDIQTQAEQQLRKLLCLAVEKAKDNGELIQADIPEFVVEIPADSSNGDFATNIAMIGARVFKQAPKMIAQQIVDNIVLDDTYFDRCEIAGPGFINFFLNKTWFSEAIIAVLGEESHYGKTNFGLNKKVLVEFVSANPTGPMHIGNARGGAIGDCLSEILSWAGYSTSREFYVNDAGNQIEKFKKSLSIRYQQLFLGEQAVPLSEDCYQGADITQRAKDFADIYRDKYMNVSEDERRQALVEYALPLNISGLKTDLLKYKIEYDKWFLESDLHKQGKLYEIVDMLKSRGYIYEDGGAVWFKATEFGGEKDDVLIRDNGIPTYFLADIAYHYNKLVDRGFDKAIDIWGADHHGHVARLKWALEALGIDPKRLDIILMQMVRLVRDGETVKLSKRSGKSITLTSLLDEIPIDAARFLFNMREANSHFDFDLDLAIEESSKNPVYYVQYAHARICQILKNLEELGYKPSINSEYELLNTKEEIELIKAIAKFPSEIIAAACSYNPSRITRFALDIATLFHKFYTVCKVKGSEENLLNARLSLCCAVKITLKNALTILNISAPEEM